MTIALAIAVSDGIVMASDSATTLMATTATGAVGVLNVYESANKVFNLRKGSPLGAYTYGAGSLGDTSIATLAKDFRSMLDSGKLIGPGKWHFQPKSFKVEEVAIAARQFLYEDRYVPAFGAATDKPVFGFNIGGYSSGAAAPELWQILVDNTGTCPPPVALRRQGEFGLSWSGEPEAIHRLVIGFGSQTGEALASIGLAPADVPIALQVLQGALEIGVAPPAMPIQDVIELAEFLVYVSIKFSKFKPGAPTVGGPIEVAAITKHEGFKWIQRKHYYDSRLNPSG